MLHATGRPRHPHCCWCPTLHRRSHNGRSQVLHGGLTLTCARPLQREWSASIGAASRACSQGTKPEPRVSIRHQSGASGGVGHDHDGGTQRRGAGPCRGPKMGKAKQKVASDAQRRTSRRRVVRFTLLVGLDVQLCEHLVHIGCAGSLWVFSVRFRVHIRLARSGWSGATALVLGWSRTLTAVQSRPILGDCTFCSSFCGPLVAFGGASELAAHCGLCVFFSGTSTSLEGVWWWWVL